jgi:hypothetical protein
MKAIFLQALIVLAAVLGLCPLFSPQKAFLQTGCPDIPSRGAQNAWPPDSTVEVNIDPSFNDDQKAAIRGAFNA